MDKVAKSIPELLFKEYRPKKGHTREIYGARSNYYSEVRAEFRERAADSFTNEASSPKESLTKVQSSCGWSQSHTDTLKAMNQKDWLKLFIELDGTDEFSQLFRKAVSLRDELEPARQTATQALIELARNNPFSKFKLEHWLGKSIDDLVD